MIAVDIFLVAFAACFTAVTGYAIYDAVDQILRPPVTGMTDAKRIPDTDLRIAR